jgi:hypothetical protein
VGCPSMSVDSRVPPTARTVFGCFSCSPMALVPGLARPPGEGGPDAVVSLQVAIMTVCFCMNYGANPPPTLDVVKGFIPEIRSYAVPSAVGLIGAVIMPHNIFLHSALVLSRRINRSKPREVSQCLLSACLGADQGG